MASLVLDYVVFCRAMGGIEKGCLRVARRPEAHMDIALKTLHKEEVENKPGLCALLPIQPTVL